MLLVAERNGEVIGYVYASVEGFINLPVVGRYLVPAVRSGEGTPPTAGGVGGHRS